MHASLRQVLLGHSEAGGGRGKDGGGEAQNAVKFQSESYTAAFEMGRGCGQRMYCLGNSAVEEECWSRNRSIELQPQRLSELPLLLIETVEKVHAQLDSGSYLQQVGRARTQTCRGLPGQLTRPLKDLV